MDDHPEDEHSNKFRGPGSPGVGEAKGYALQALELIQDEDVHLCADGPALEDTINALQNAIDALRKNAHDVPGYEEVEETRTAPKSKHYRSDGSLHSGDADADGDGGPKYRSDPTDKPGKGD